jgi:hypothetical protein
MSFLTLGMDTGEDSEGEIVAFAMLAQPAAEAQEEALAVVGGDLAERVDSGRGGEGEGGGSQPGGWLQALRQIAMGFVFIGPTIGCLAITFAIGQVRGAIDRAVDNMGEAMIAAGEKLKNPKK